MHLVNRVMLRFIGYIRDTLHSRTGRDDSVNVVFLFLVLSMISGVRPPMRYTFSGSCSDNAFILLSSNKFPTKEIVNGAGSKGVIYILTFDAL